MAFKEPQPSARLLTINGQPAYSGANALTHNSYPEAFMANLHHFIENAKAQNSVGALLLVQLTNLPMIVSGYGFEVSENVITGLMQSFQTILGKDDAIERLQRDQVGILLSRSYPEETERTAYRLLTILQNYGRDNFATASLHLVGTVGSVHFPLEAESPQEAVDRAYVAMHGLQGLQHRSYEQSKHEADNYRQQMGLASYLYNAFQEKRLRLAWQPIVESSTGNIAHYEALLRIIGTNGKISSAGALIPVAEKMGLIDLIDMMVLEMTVDELVKNPDVSVAFNVSNLTTENNVWLERAHELLANRPDITSRLVVEITETAAHRDLRRVAYFVASLQSLGCQVALDDFGSGYTSFRQLKALSVDFVKIDGVFIKDIATNADSRFFVKTLLDFARGFGLKSVAEFVENGEIAKILMELGVDYMQGYYFGKPQNHRTWLNEGEYKRD